MTNPTTPEDKIDAILKKLQIETLKNADAAGDDSLAQDLLPLAWGKRRDEALHALLALLDEARDEKGRYCGICYKPSINIGGWKCVEHGYNSVYISRSEAAQLRAATPKENKA